jgi:hypothetical protein
MTITSDNFFSWPVAVWFGAGAISIALAWFLTARAQVMWQQRVFFRAAVIALCFTPLPALEMFTEAAMGGRIAIIPLWYVLLHSFLHGVLLVALVALIPWLVVTYVFWVARMSMHHAFSRKHA